VDRTYIIEALNSHQSFCSDKEMYNNSAQKVFVKIGDDVRKVVAIEQDTILGISILTCE
jgi:hypothetical protein